MSYLRHIEEDLLNWKKRDDRKPLVLRGARQVGKTTIVKHFAKSFQHKILFCNRIRVYLIIICNKIRVIIAKNCNRIRVIPINNLVFNYFF